MLAMTETSLIGNALRNSLEVWAKNSRAYGALFKTLPKEVLEVALVAFNEMPKVSPSGYDLWWLMNHNRFIYKHKQRELLLLYEIMYHFLTAFARGELGEKAGGSADPGTAKSAKKARPQ